MEQFSNDKGQPLIRLKHESGAVCECHLFGATITKFATASRRDLIWVSSTAKLDGTKAIRGGIPLVFPQFGQPIKEMAQHGFARSSTWKVAEPGRVNAAGELECTLSLDQTMATHEAWPHAYELRFVIKVAAEKLTTQVVVVNTGDAPFNFMSLQHTYLDVGDVAATTVEGLQGGRFMDKTTSNPAVRNIELRELATVGAFTDRVYSNLSSPGALRIETPKGLIAVAGDGVLTEGGQSIVFPSDIVMWNPWAQNAKGMADFDDEGYKQMLCIEPGFVSEFHVLNPKASLSLRQILSTTLSSI